MWAHRVPLKMLCCQIQPLVCLSHVTRHRAWRVAAHDVSHHRFCEVQLLAGVVSRVGAVDLRAPSHSCGVEAVAKIVQSARRCHQLLHRMTTEAELFVQRMISSGTQHAMATGSLPCRAFESMAVICK